MRPFRPGLESPIPRGFHPAGYHPAGGRPRFSKYMGALEWKNAVCLFVNVGGAEYNNLFLDDGRMVTWFAG